MASNRQDPLGNEQSLTNQLKGKGRNRRESLTRLARPGASARAPRNDVLPQLDLVYIPLDELRMPGRKIRKSDPAHVREVAGTISALGFCVPVLVGKNNLVIDGEVRVEAAKLLGLGRAPCVRIDHLSEDEQRVAAPRRQSPRRKGPVGPRRTQDRVRGTDPRRRADRDLRASRSTKSTRSLSATSRTPPSTDRLRRNLARSPSPGSGDVFLLGPHRSICGDATDPAVLYSR